MVTDRFRKDTESVRDAVGFTSVAAMKMVAAATKTAPLWLWLGHGSDDTRRCPRICDTGGDTTDKWL